MRTLSLGLLLVLLCGCVTMQNWTIPRLVDALQSSDEAESDAAAAELVRRGPIAIPDLLEAGYESPKAVDCLVQMGKPGLRQLIPAMLENGDLEISMVAMAALVRMGEPARDPLLKKLADPRSFHVRDSILLCLKRQGADVLPDLIRYATPNRDDPIRKLIVSFGPEAVPLLDKLVKSQDPAERLTAAMIVKAIGEPAIEQAIVLLEDPDFKVYHEMCEINRGQFGDSQRKLIPVLQKLCQQDASDSGTRQRVKMAAVTLGKITDDTKLIGPSLSQAIETTRYDNDLIDLGMKHARGFEDKAEEVLKVERAHAVYTVGQMSDETIARVAGRLSELFEQQDSYRHYAALDVLCKHPETLEEHLNLIRKDAFRPKHGKLSSELRDRTIPHVMHAAASDDEALREKAGELLMHYVTEGSAPARVKLVEGLQSENDRLVIGLLRALSQVPFDAEEMMPPLISLLEHPGAEVRLNAARAIGSHDPWSEQAKEKLEEILPNEKDEDVRQQIEQTLNGLEQE